MIKVIKAPAPRKINQYRVTCKHCGTIFECDDTDFHDEIVGHGDYDTLVHCPTCQSRCSNRLAPYFCIVETLNADNDGYISPRDGKYYHYVDRQLDERDVPPTNHGGGPNVSDWF